jgi:bacteriochlorophyllide a dehydrogenase
METQAILFTGVDQVALDRVEIPQPGVDQVVVATAFSCVSPGTELRCLAGRQPEALPWPFIPGYSLTGTVIAAGANAQLAVGTAVFCTGTAASVPAPMWGGHTAHAVRDARSVIPLPAGLDLLEASMVHMIAIAYRGVRLARPQPHERVAVLGLGLIGQLSARLFAATGARVIAADTAPGRVAQARNAGLEALVVEGSLAQTFEPVFPGGADIIVDATGVPAVLPEAIPLAAEIAWDDPAKQGARYVVQGSYPAEFAVPYQAAFRKELSFHLPRDMRTADVPVALDLLGRRRLRVDDLIFAVLAPAEAPRAYADLRRPEAGLVTVAFKWD